MSEILTEKNFTEAVPTAPVRIVKFTNFSDEDFTHTWNKVPYTFKAGEVKFMETGLGLHFAKHFVNRELLKRGRDTDTSPKKPNENPFFMELFDRCISPVEESATSDATKAAQDVIDRNMKEKLGIKDAPEAAPAAPTKETKPAKKASKSSKAKKEEEEFEIEEGPADDEE